MVWRRPVRGGGAGQVCKVRCKKPGRFWSRQGSSKVLEVVRWSGHGTGVRFNCRVQAVQGSSEARFPGGLGRL